MVPGDALLVHGSLPPAHIGTRAYYRHRGLRRLAALDVDPAKVARATPPPDPLEELFLEQEASSPQRVVT